MKKTTTVILYPSMTMGSAFYPPQSGSHQYMRTQAINYQNVTFPEGYQ